MFQSNPQLEIAFDYVRHTNKNIFLTGKAGTGKTTFLHKVKTETHKRMAVVAPTGVAAINAGGVTIHSLFQLPFGAYLPGNTKDFARQRKFTREKIRLLQSLDLLVIDEISMVRADMLDAIDDVLRRFKDHNKPFGGVQLLMIGDLHQLPPVIKDDEWEALRSHYDTLYFFGSHALQKTNPVAVELKHIYRQSDSFFIDLLNKVRNNRMDAQVLEALNSRFIPDFQPTESDNYITLASHNATAQEINNQKLAAIKGDIYAFKAETEGDFPTFSYPTDEEIKLKINAQVMFVKNDISQDKRYYNGKIGKVTKINNGIIHVKCPNETDEILVAKAEWKNVKYNLNEETKEVEEETVGVFIQFPLKLAWAITIHKSQGLTFERAVIDANAAFAHGQVYVALSRCKTFEGIVLKSKIANSSVRTDTVVRNYSENIDKNAPDSTDLNRSKIEYQQSLIIDLFDFAAIKRQLEQLRRLFLENDNIVNKSALNSFDTFRSELDAQVLTIAEKFKPQMQQYFNQTDFPEDNDTLQTRLQKASVYFQAQLKDKFLKDILGILVETDNKAVKKSISEALEILEKSIYVKNDCFASCQEKFTSNDYLRAKNNSELDFQTAKKTFSEAPPKSAANTVIKDSEHPELYIKLKKWRDDTAADLDTEGYMILPAKTLLDLSNTLPANERELKSVKGIGAAKIKTFGSDILKIINDYAEEMNIERLEPELPVVIKLPKPDTKQVSFDLYKSGKNILEIAEIRGFAESTIQVHLTHFIETGEIEITEMLDEKSVAELMEYYEKHDSLTTSDAYNHFQGKYFYPQLRMILAYRAFLKKSEI